MFSFGGHAKQRGKPPRATPSHAYCTDQ